MRLSDKKRAVIQLLEEEGIEEAALEASLFIEKATGFDRGAQLLHASKELPDRALSLIDEYTAERIQHIPNAYILGYKEFWGLRFKVTPAVLIPRPDTETLVECCIDFLKDKEKATLLDLCTGSGCVGISIAHDTKAELTISDISEEALEVAKENAETLLDQEFCFVSGDLFTPLKDRRFTCIATNPPYLTDSWWDEVTEEVKREPEKAFLGFGSDGLSLIRKIIEQAGSHLEEDGLLALECDYRQTEECAILMKTAGFEDVRIIRDLSGLERVVRGVWHARKTST